MQTEKEKIRILIVDDHALVADAWKLILNSIENFEVIGTKESAEDALIFCLAQKPDIVLMDLEMPEMTGLEVGEKMNHLGITSKKILLTLHKELFILQKVKELQFSGYILKEFALGELDIYIYNYINIAKFII